MVSPGVQEMKEKIREGLEHYEVLYGKGSTDKLKEQLESVDHPATVFRMWQIFREASGLEDTSFKMCLKDGTIKEFKNLKEADNFFGVKNE